jgi:hAT family C-terminal dimerisation region
VIKVRDSPQRRQRFARHCTGAGASSKTLIADVRTRWSSTHAMIERALELREPLDAMALTTELTNYGLEAEEWQLLESVLPFFAAFKAATDYLCADTRPTLAAAVPVYNLPLDKLDDYRDACDADVLQWWKVNATTYPCLAAMARDCLAIPATGAPVERVFSGGATLVQPRRGCGTGARLASFGLKDVFQPLATQEEGQTLC